MHTEVQVVILVFSLLFLAAIISILLKRIRLPFTVAILLVGLLLGTLAASDRLQRDEQLNLDEPTTMVGDFLNTLEGMGNLSPELILFICV